MQSEGTAQNNPRFRKFSVLDEDFRVGYCWGGDVKPIIIITSSTKVWRNSGSKISYIGGLEYLLKELLNISYLKHSTTHTKPMAMKNAPIRPMFLRYSSIGVGASYRPQLFFHSAFMQSYSDSHVFVSARLAHSSEKCSRLSPLSYSLIQIPGGFTAPSTAKRDRSRQRAKTKSTTLEQNKLEAMSRIFVFGSLFEPHLYTFQSEPTASIFFVFRIVYRGKSNSALGAELACGKVVSRRSTYPQYCAISSHASLCPVIS